MADTTTARLLRGALALIMLAAGIAALTNFDRMGHRFHVLGTPGWMRWLAGLEEIAAAVLLWVPGRVAYGAALALLASVAALIAHATSLGWDSAPPAMALAALSASILWKTRAQLKT